MCSMKWDEFVRRRKNERKRLFCEAKSTTSRGATILSQPLKRGVRRGRRKDKEVDGSVMSN